MFLYKDFRISSRYYLLALPLEPTDQSHLEGVRHLSEEGFYGRHSRSCLREDRRKACNRCLTETAAALPQAASSGATFSKRSPRKSVVTFRRKNAEPDQKGHLLTLRGSVAA